jgi:hypothetical protein
MRWCAQLRHLAAGPAAQQVVSWLSKMTRYPNGLGVAFGAGAAVAGVVYAFVSVYIFHFIEHAWGTGGSFQVVVMLTFAFSVVSAVAFGFTLTVLRIPQPQKDPRRPHLIAALLGALTLVVAGLIAFSLQSLESVVIAVLVFAGCAVIAAVAYRHWVFVPKHAAS